jgi:hypothetical protein
MNDKVSKINWVSGKCEHGINYKLCQDCIDDFEKRKRHNEKATNQAKLEAENAELKARWEKLKEEVSLDKNQCWHCRCVVERMQELESGYEPAYCPGHLFTDRSGKRIDFCIKCKMPKPGSKRKANLQGLIYSKTEEAGKG